MSECPLASSSRIFFDINDETATGRLHPTDIATPVSTSAGRDVLVYDVPTLVERGIYNIGFAHEKDPGTHQKKLMASRAIQWGLEYQTLSTQHIKVLFSSGPKTRWAPFCSVFQ